MKQVTDHEFELALEKYGALIHYFSKKYFLKGFDEEDLRQEFRMILFNCMRYYDEDKKTASFLTYFTQAVRNFVTNELISKRQKIEFIYLEEAFTSMLNTQDNVEAMQIIYDIEKRISDAFKLIPMGEHFLRIAYGESQITIAKELKVSSQYISFMYLKAIKQVKEELDEDLILYDTIKQKYNLNIDLQVQHKEIIWKELNKHGK